MTWSRVHTLAAAFGLLALTNAVALVGVAWNRSGEDAQLRLTQRELSLRGEWRRNRENSGMTLGLVWRMPREEEPADTLYYGTVYGRGREHGWLDRAKMEALGFDTAVVAYSDRSRARYEKQLPRDVLLVLEFDGPAYRRSLELAREYLARAEAQLASNPGGRELATRAKLAREGLERETRRNSRVFAVDAGLDREALRAKYPDRSRYALVRGQVRPARIDSKTWKVGGYLVGPSIEAINVPYGLREMFGPITEIVGADERDKAPYEATVAFGKRLEPWIVEAARK